MADVPFEDPSEEMWGVADFEGPVHARPLSEWLSRSKSLLPACRHWREPVGLLHEVMVFASAWFDRPMTGRGVDMSWPDVGFYLDGSWSAGVLVCSPGFRPPFAQRPRSQIVVYPWPDLGAPRDPRRFARALRWLLGQASGGRRVEIGCAGGHGRTGTTLAGLLVLQGLSARSAIRRVRRAYREDAIESREQEAFVRDLAG
jgi:protein-tyrosine phosphatase